MKRLIINTIAVFAFLTATVTLSSCGNAGNKKVTKEEKAKTDTTKKEEGIAEVTAEQMEAVGIEMGVIEQKNLTRQCFFVFHNFSFLINIIEVQLAGLMQAVSA